MSLETDQSQLNDAMKELLAKWSATQSSWRDEVSRSFEEKYMAPLETNVRKAVDAMSHMSAVLNKARRDCQ